MVLEYIVFKYALSKLAVLTTSGLNKFGYHH